MTHGERNSARRFDTVLSLHIKPTLDAEKASGHNLVGRTLLFSRACMHHNDDFYKLTLQKPGAGAHI